MASTSGVLSSGLQALLHAHVGQQSTTTTAARMMLASVTLQNASKTAQQISALGVASNVQLLLPALEQATTEQELGSAVINLQNALGENTGLLGNLLTL